jgi:hypothetical protein
MLRFNQTGDPGWAEHVDGPSLTTTRHFSLLRVVLHSLGSTQFHAAEEQASRALRPSLGASWARLRVIRFPRTGKGQRLGGRELALCGIG